MTVDTRSISQFMFRENCIDRLTDPDLERKRVGGGLDLLALLVFFPSVISSCFTQNKGGPRDPPLDPPLVIQTCTMFNIAI